MAYLVKTPDGELSYASLYDIERAYAQGLIDPEDEVKEEGSELWRKVNAIPALRGARPAARSAGPATRLGFSALAAVLLGAAALYLLATSPAFTRPWFVGLGLVLVASAVASRVTYKAFKK